MPLTTGSRVVVSTLQLELPKEKSEALQIKGRYEHHANHTASD